MEYKLPKRDGKLDWARICELVSIGGAETTYLVGKALDVSARAEERERCARVAALPSCTAGGDAGDKRAGMIAAAIRNPAPP